MFFFFAHKPKREPKPFDICALKPSEVGKYGGLGMAVVVKAYPNKTGRTILLSFLLSEQKTPNASQMLPWNGRHLWAVTQKVYFLKTWQIRGMIGKLDERIGIELLQLSNYPLAPAIKGGSARTTKSGFLNNTGNVYQLAFRGDYWQIRFSGKEGLVRNLIGLRYIAILIRDAGPGKDSMHARALVALAHGLQTSSAGPESARELGLAVEAQDTDEVLNETGRNKYKNRLMEIRHERAAAKSEEDISKLDVEADEIKAELKRRSFRKGNTSSNSFPAEDEKARKAVSNAITYAIEKISAISTLNDLAEHLRKNIEKGTSLSYQGTLDWDVRL